MQGVLKLKQNNSDAKRVTGIGTAERAGVIGRYASNTATKNSL
jgi:hypothetical protein